LYHSPYEQSRDHSLFLSQETQTQAGRFLPSYGSESLYPLQLPPRLERQGLHRQAHRRKDPRPNQSLRSNRQNLIGINFASSYLEDEVTMIIYEVLGIPAPWQAPLKGKHGFYSRPVKNAPTKEQVIWQLKAQVNHEPMSGPLYANITFYRPVPASTSNIKKKQMLNGLIFPIGKPDRSNMLKFIEDCLENAGIISNDSIIIDGPTRKLYGEIPKTVIILLPISVLNDEKVYQNNQKAYESNTRNSR